MSVVIGIVLVVAVAVAIAYPLIVPAVGQTTGALPVAEELWRREKSVALLAIREAEFDHAMGKLSEEDYRTLRGRYEQRALDAIGQLDEPTAEAPAAAACASADTGTPTAASSAAFCTQCGRGFQNQDRFCAGCGAQRS